MPRGFEIDGKPAQVYTPMRRDPASKAYLPVTVYAHLKPGVTSPRRNRTWTASRSRRDIRNSGWKARVWSLRESMIRDLRLSLLVLLGAVALVLLIACANVASLLLARSSARRQEVGIRAALGAPRGRLLRQFLTESLLLGGTGAAAGLLLATWSMRLIPSLDNERLPNVLLATRIDSGVLAFTALIAIATSVLFGIVPALSAVPLRVQERRTDTRRGKRVWNALVVSETALALVLLIGATMLDPQLFLSPRHRAGFPCRRVADRERHAAIRARVGEGPRDPRRRFRHARVQPAARRRLPVDEHADRRPASHAPQDMPILWHRYIEADYFRTMGIPLRRGRAFTAQDGRE